MFHGSHPSTYKRGYEEDTTYFPSAEKSLYRQTEPYIERTPERRGFASPPASSRTSEARKSINEAIYLVSEKKKMNEQAISQVQHVNSEILNCLTNSQPVRHGGFDYRNKTSEPYRRADDYRDYVATSEFDWRAPTPQVPAAPYAPESMKHSYRSTTVNQGDLTGRLNDEIRKNSDLNRQVSHLESEVSALKAGRNHSYSNSSMNELLEENRYLKSQLAASQSKVPYNLIEELEKLKAENNALRKDTVNLLKIKQQH